MRRRIPFLSLLLAVSALGGELAPQALAPYFQGEDCGVVNAALRAYRIHGQEEGPSSGFAGLHFFVMDRTEAIAARQLPRSRYFFTEADNAAFDRLRQQAVYSSLVRRAGFSRQVCPCDLPTEFAFIPSAESVATGDRWPVPSPVWERFDAIITLSLPGYSSDDCHALINVRANFDLWEEQYLYYLTKTGETWAVEHAFQTYMQGD